ncbi:MAG: HigA family addiction module antidote protein [Nitrospinae bacterium]|nr:HigA family addiction module antidote protein [Nitrospinota bacterium]
MAKDWRDPIHPGEILADELEEIGINGHELAQRIKVPHNRIYQILGGKRGITADTAMRLGKFFGSGPEIWLNLQQKFDLQVARKEECGELKKIKPFKRPKAKPPAQAPLNL